MGRLDGQVAVRPRGVSTHEGVQRTVIHPWQRIPDRRVDRRRALPTIEALRKRSGVRFLWGERVDDKPHLTELRWPKPRRKLTAEQQYLLTRGLQVMARAADRNQRTLGRRICSTIR
jgi:hypothetical protein